MPPDKEPCALAPDEAFARLSQQRGCCWLDSGAAPSPLARYSIIAANPALSLRAYGQRVEVIQADSIEVRLGDSLAILDEIRSERAANSKGLAYASGGIGSFSYEFGRRLAGQRILTGNARRWPDFHFHFFDAAYVFDHGAQQAWLHARNDQAGRQAREKLAHNLSDAAPARKHAQNPHRQFTANRGRDDYCAAVESIRQAIAAGEIYQANLAQFFSTPFHGAPSGLFTRLRKSNPAPYSAFIDQGNRQILSSSPELFLRITPDRTITTRPIKGTRPRGETVELDSAQRDSLIASSKERAELLMIVDMERNDLGRVAETGSVKVNHLYAIESYATVHHLVGEVEATLRKDASFADVLRATFPGGSITGAPKLQAMEVIARHEPKERDVFCGAIGYLGDDGAVELNVAIRTITCQENRADFGVGAGIVWDSQPQAEYEETLHKAAALFRALSGN